MRQPAQSTEVRSPLGRHRAPGAGGVDAACVARALKEVIHAQSPEGNDLDRGIWVIPLLANYDGTFYTEEPIFPTNFNAEETIKQVRADIDRLNPNLRKSQRR